MNMFVWVGGNVFNQTLSEFRNGKEFVDFYKKAVLDDFDFRSGQSKIIFTNGENGLSFSFYGNPGDPSDIPFKGRQVFSVTIYRFKEEHQITGTKTFYRERLERVSLFGPSVDKILTIEKFFGKRLSSEVLKLLWRKTAEFDVLVSPHPKEGHPTLMTKASRFSSIPTKDKKRLYILAEKNDDVSYKKFIGQVLLNEKPGDIYKDKKSRARNKTDTKNLGNELKDNQDFWR